MTHEHGALFHHGLGLGQRALPMVGKDQGLGVSRTWMIPGTGQAACKTTDIFDSWQVAFTFQKLW